ncbi:hypothetical protein BHE74_00003839 [Ensete ventricosum]|nr:hypothetical protein BHE74_00003839 [Ensete ventricosum]
MSFEVSFFFSRCMSFVSLIDTCDPSGNAVCITVRGGMQRSSMFLDSGYWISPIMQFKVQLGRSWLISRVSIFTFRASTTIRYRVFLLICLVVTLIVAKEVPLGDPAQSGAKLDSKGGQAHSQNEDRVSFIDIFKAFKNLPPGMPSVLLVTSLTWLSWFPFILYDTDWMGREVYHGNPSGTPAQIDAYDRGVRQGAVGLLLNSVRKLEMVVLMITSLLIEPMCRKLTPRIVWVISNMTMFAGMAGTSIISTWSMKDFHGSIQSVITADGEVRAAALATFAALGFPLAVSINQHSQASTDTYQWVPNTNMHVVRILFCRFCTVALHWSFEHLGCRPAGPWDSLFGKGNIPAFALASAIAFVAGVVGTFKLPRLSRKNFKSVGMAGGH